MLLDLSEAVRYNHSRGDAGNTGNRPMGGYKSDPKADSGSNHLEKKRNPSSPAAAEVLDTDSAKSALCCSPS